MKTEQQIRDRLKSEKLNKYSPKHKEIAEILEWVLGDKKHKDIITDKSKNDLSDYEV